MDRQLICDARDETGDADSKVGHATHFCRQVGTHAYHKCAACGSLFRPARTFVYTPVAKNPDRVYYVYRDNSALPVTGPWRDKDAALLYAEDHACDVVLGIDVADRWVRPHK